MTVSKERESEPFLVSNGLTPLWESFSTVSDGFETLAKTAATRMLVVHFASEKTSLLSMLSA